jgi:hypothetical protein
MNNFKKMKYIGLIIISLFFFVGAHSQFVATTSYGGGGASALLDSLFAYYSLDDPSGDATDDHGSNDLSLTGGVTQGVTGHVGDCYTFLTNGYLGEEDTEFEFGGSVSVSLWIKTGDTDAYSYMLACTGGAIVGWELYVRDPGGGGKANWRIGDGTDWTLLYGSTTINDDGWHHIAASYSTVDDSVKLWVDGDPDDTFEQTGGDIAYHANSRFSVARKDGVGVSTDFLDGELDEIAIYQLEFSQGMVDSLYNSGNGLAYPLDY